MLAAKQLHSSPSRFLLFRLSASADKRLHKSAMPESADFARWLQPLLSLLRCVMLPMWTGHTLPASGCCLSCKAACQMFPCGCFGFASENIRKWFSMIILALFFLLFVLDKKAELYATIPLFRFLLILPLT